MRKAQAKRLPLAPDGRFNDKLVTRFINNLMWDGKKSTAINIFYDAVDKVSKITGEEGYEIWKRAIANITPSVEVRSRDIYFASFPCFTASNTALAQARANLNELLQLLGVPLEI